MSLQSQLDHAQARLQQGQLEQAIKIYTEILGSDRYQPDALYMLGAIAFKLGELDPALEFITAMAAHAPDDARGWMLKALILRTQKQSEGALQAARKALVLDDSLAEAWECAGMALMQFGKWDEARAHFECAVKRLPENASLRGCSALVLAEQGDLPAAWQECRRALASDAYNHQARFAEITILMHAGYCDLALARCRDAGQSETFAFTRATAALSTGNFEEGYALLAAAKALHAPEKSLPDWQGESDPNLHLVLYGDQGYGDTLQLIRLTRRVREKVGRVTLRVPQQLERLIRHSMPDLSLSVYKPLTTEARRVMHEIDPVFEFPADAKAKCALMRLPHLLQIGANTDADCVPYLKANPAWVAPWRERIAKIPSPRIGICWNGSAQNPTDHRRSIPFADLAPLIEKFRQHLVSIQTGAGGADARAAGMFDASVFISDFADSAGLMEELDLVITVDTAPAHLAGGMGKPCWLALAFDNDWRWLIGRDDSIWYPSLRLFRQPQPGDWVSVVKRLGDGLEKLIAGDSSALTPPPWMGRALERNPDAADLPDI